MARLCAYPLKQRLDYFHSLPLSQLTQQARASSCPAPLLRPHSPSYSKIKAEIMEFMPEGSFSTVKTSLDYLFPILPKFSFTCPPQSTKQTRLEVAITCILIGDLFNRAMGHPNNRFNNVLPPKYLLLTADFFHIKGAVWGSSLGHQSVSTNMAKIQTDLAKFSLLTGNNGLLSLNQLGDALEWKASPQRYGYKSLLELEEGGSEEVERGEVIGHTIGLIKTLQNYDSKPLIKLFHFDDQIKDIKADPAKLSLAKECILSELYRLLQRAKKPSKQQEGDFL